MGRVTINFGPDGDGGGSVTVRTKEKTEVGSVTVTYQGLDGQSWSASFSSPNWIDMYDDDDDDDEDDDLEDDPEDGGGIAQSQSSLNGQFQYPTVSDSYSKRNLYQQATP